MVTLTMLWLPILLSAVLVFIATMLAWMVLPHHRTDWRRLPDEDAFAEAIRKQSPELGQYGFPHAANAKERKSPEYQKKLKEGPMGMLYLMGPPQMGKSLVLYFIYNLIISVLVAYLAGRTLAAGSEYLAVFRVAGTAAILGYAGALAPASIWMGKSWSSTLKDVIDGIVYGLLTAGVFGWLWP